MQAVTAILILGAIASLVAWVILLLLEHGIRPVHSMVHFVRRLPWSGRLAVLPLFIALVVVGSTKFSGNNVSDGNNLQMTNAVEGVVSGGVAVGRQDAPVTNSESDMPNSEQESIGATADEVTSSGSAGAETQIQLPVNDGEIAVPDSITALDCEAGFVLSGVGYGEEFDFAPPENAVVCEDWLRFGAHEDWIYIGPGAWSSRFGSNFVEKVRVFSCGGIDFFPEGHISLLNNPISIAPAANWHLLSVSNSMFWHAETPSNTLVLTWQNVFLNRSTNSPASFQMEMWPNGNFVYRYDLSRTGLWDGNAPSNITVGAVHDGISRTVDVSSLTNLTSLHFHHLDPADLPGSDRDGDGLSVEDELVWKAKTKKNVENGEEQETLIWAIDLAKVECTGYILFV